MLAAEATFARHYGHVGRATGGTLAPWVKRSLCGRCGSTMIYEDPDGYGCLICGAHDWSRARQRGYGLRGMMEQEPYLHGTRGRDD